MIDGIEITSLAYSRHKGKRIYELPDIYKNWLLSLVDTAYQAKRLNVLIQSGEFSKQRIRKLDKIELERLIDDQSQTVFMNELAKELLAELQEKEREETAGLERLVRIQERITREPYRVEPLTKPKKPTATKYQTSFRINGKNTDVSEWSVRELENLKYSRDNPATKNTINKLIKAKRYYGESWTPNSSCPEIQSIETARNA